MNPRERSHTLFKTAASFLFLAAALAAVRPARADDTIRHPGDHPHYTLEAEPHALLGFGWGYGGGAVGLGGRFTIPIVQNGFISEINNSVGIGFGLDVLWFNSCYYNGGCSATYFDIPVVMQWNFFVAKRWSVFGEPGIFIYFDNYDACGGPGCPGAPARFGPGPAIFIGGRYHLSESVSLTMRLGFPSFSFGLSFFP